MTRDEIAVQLLKGYIACTSFVGAVDETLEKAVDTADRLLVILARTAPVEKPPLGPVRIFCGGCDSEISENWITLSCQTCGRMVHTECETKHKSFFCKSKAGGT